MTHAQKLALRVKEMHAPAKSYDPEDEDFFGGARLDTAPVDESEEEERTVLKSTLRSGIDIEALGESYKGAVTSRKQLEEDSDVAFSDDDMTDGEREAASAALERALGSMEYSDDDDDNDDDDEDENEEGDSGEGEEESDSDSDSEGNLMERLGHDESMLNAEQKALRAQLAALEDEEDTEIFRKKAAEDDIAKAKSVKNQHTLSEQNMDLRIRLQGPLSVANRLPQYDMHSEFVSNSKSVKKAFKKASKSTSALLVDLLEAQTKMMEVNPILGEPAVYEPRYKKSEKRKKSSGSETDEDKAGVLDLDHVWDHISSVQSRMEPLYKDVIDQWNRRTQLSSGSQNATSKRFKAINQVCTSLLSVFSPLCYFFSCSSSQPTGFFFVPLYAFSYAFLRSSYRVLYLRSTHFSPTKMSWFTALRPRERPTRSSAREAKSNTSSRCRRFSRAKWRSMTLKSTTIPTFTRFC